MDAMWTYAVRRGLAPRQGLIGIRHYYVIINRIKTLGGLSVRVGPITCGELIGIGGDFLNIAIER